jgi:hypothetical protein
MTLILADDDYDDLDPVDEEALTRALEMARLEPGRSEQLDHKLAREPWEQVARFAAYCCQCDSLRLGPHQSPPCWVNDMADLVADPDDPDDIYGRRAAAVAAQAHARCRALDIRAGPARRAQDCGQIAGRTAPIALTDSQLREQLADAFGLDGSS